MNNLSTPNRRRLIFAAALLFTLLLVAATFLQWDRNRKRSPSYVEKTINRDTGEIVYNTPNITPEKGGGEESEEINVFGGFLILNNGATPAQFSKIKDLLNEYSVKNLLGEYSSLTIIPKGFESDSGKLEGQIRLGDTEKVVSLTIVLSDITFVQVKVHDPTGQIERSYDSGRQLVDADFYGPQEDYTY